MNKLFTPLALLLLMTGASSFAETPWKDFYLKGGIANPQADSRDMTNKSKGFTFEAGYVVTPTLWQGEVRFYLGYVKMGGGDQTPWIKGEGPNGSFRMPYSEYAAMTTNDQANYSIKEQKFSYDMTGHTLGVDFVFPLKAFNRDFTVFTGPSLHQWYMVKINPKEPQADRNVKTGWRLGATYKHDEHLEFSAAYTLTEWRSIGGSAPYEEGANPSRPAYVTLTAGYRF